MVEVTLRTIQGRLLLRPTREATRTVVGVIGRAQRRHGMTIHAAVAMGNHMHLLLSPTDAYQMAQFMAFVGSNIARKVGALVGWRDRFWGRRYRAIVVSDEESAQVARLRYLLAHGAKEGFVLEPADWPGVHPARPLTDGSMAIAGTWYDGTAACRDRATGRRRARKTYEQAETLRLTPLPCLQHLTAGRHREIVADLLEDIRRETLERHATAQSAPVGTRAVLSRDPHDRPNRLERSPAPAFHAATRACRQRLRAAYAAFVLAYREAASRLREGDRTVRFPAGCFPPALPFEPG